MSRHISVIIICNVSPATTATRPAHFAKWVDRFTGWLLMIKNYISAGLIAKPRVYDDEFRRLFRWQGLPGREWANTTSIHDWYDARYFDMGATLLARPQKVPNLMATSSTFLLPRSSSIASYILYYKLIFIAASYFAHIYRYAMPQYI